MACQDELVNWKYVGEFMRNFSSKLFTKIQNHRWHNQAFKTSCFV